MGPTPPNIAGHIALYGSRLLDGQENLWKTTWRSCGRFECELGYLGNVYEYHSSSSSSSRKEHELNLRFVKNYLKKTTGRLFRETEKLISGQTETTGISLINFQDMRWASTSFLHSPAYQYSTAKVCIFSDSVLCLGKMGDNPVESWKKQNPMVFRKQFSPN